MRAMAYRVGQKPELLEIENTLEALQKFVGGYIERVGLEHGLASGLAILCDEEGKLKGKPLNTTFYPFGYGVGRKVVGDFLIVREKNGTFVDLTDPDVRLLGRGA